jgi:hypothetical protein
MSAGIELEKSVSTTNKHSCYFNHKHFLMPLLQFLRLTKISFFYFQTMWIGSILKHCFCCWIINEQVAVCMLFTCNVNVLLRKKPCPLSRVFWFPFTKNFVSNMLFDFPISFKHDVWWYLQFFKQRNPQQRFSETTRLFYWHASKISNDAFLLNFLQSKFFLLLYGL